MGWLAILPLFGGQALAAEGFRSVDRGTFAGRTLVVGGGPEGTVLLRDGNRTPLPDPADVVLLANLQGDAAAELILCGPDGVSWLDTGPVLLARPTALTTADQGACTGLTVVDGTLIAELAGSPVGLDLSDGALQAVALPDGTSLRQAGEALELPVEAPLAVPASGITSGTPTPERPSELVLGPEWTKLEVTPGESVSLLLVDGVGNADRFYAHGGPPGLEVSEVGRLRYTPAVGHAGIWRTTIQLREGGNPRWTGLVVQVADVREAPREVRAATGDPAPAQTMPAGPWEVRECFIEAGAHGGLSANRRTEWSAVGLPDIVPSGSPFVAASCAGGGDRITWFAGVDSAPAYFYLGRDARGVHLLGATLGVQVAVGRSRFGVMADGGLAFFGAGVRALVLPFETEHGGRHGPFARATVYPAGPAGALSLGYAWEFGHL